MSNTLQKCHYNWQFTEEICPVSAGRVYKKNPQASKQMKKNKKKLKNGYVIAEMKESFEGKQAKSASIRDMVMTVDYKHTLKKHVLTISS